MTADRLQLKPFKKLESELLSHNHNETFHTKEKAGF